MTRTVTGVRDVAVLEIEPEGHRLQYLRHLVDAAGAGHCVVLTSGKATASEEYAAYVADAGARTVEVPATGSRHDLLTSAVDAAVAAGVSRLVIPDGDHYLLPLLRLLLRRPRLRLEIRLLLMRTAEIGGPESLRPATLVKPALVQALRAFPQVRIRFLTDALGVVRGRRGYPGVRPLQDPVVRPTPEVAARPSWIPAPGPGCVVLGVFGVISARKNLPVLLEALAGAPSLVLVVGGRIEPDVREVLDTDAARALVVGRRLVVVDRMLPPTEFSAALQSVDVAAVLHDNDAPSGILAEACLRGTPVVVPSGGWLDRVVTE
ncbi:MAG: hypothetical protein ABW212_09115, partial [Pseudonocardia sediminis]